MVKSNYTTNTTSLCQYSNKFFVRLENKSFHWTAYLFCYSCIYTSQMCKMHNELPFEGVCKKNSWNFLNENAVKMIVSSGWEWCWIVSRLTNRPMVQVISPNSRNIFKHGIGCKLYNVDAWSFNISLLMIGCKSVLHSQHLITSVTQTSFVERLFDARTGKQAYSIILPSFLHWLAQIFLALLQLDV